MTLYLSVTAQRNHQRSGRGTVSSTIKGPSKPSVIATPPALKSAPYSPACISSPLLSCWWATTNCSVRTVLREGKDRWRGAVCIWHIWNIYIYSCICWPLHSKEESLKDIIPLMNIQKFGVGLNIFAIKKLHTYFRLTKATLHLFWLKYFF